MPFFDGSKRYTAGSTQKEELDTLVWKNEQLNKENIALDDELKTCMKEKKNCADLWDKQREKIVILEAKLEAKVRAKSKKICPTLYAGDWGSSLCKKEGCAIWDYSWNQCGHITKVVMTE